MHLPNQQLSTPARLQRAYVEISDAICTLRIETDGEALDLETLAEALHRGELSTDPGAPTLSQALPARRTRREDLELIHALARVYR